MKTIQLKTAMAIKLGHVTLIHQSVKQNNKSCDSPG